MKRSSLWIDTASLPHFAPLDRDIEVQVAIVGGGITGITAAYLLARAGFRVALVERQHLASHESGHTTAHLTCVTDSRLGELTRRFGRDHAQAVWDAGLAAILQIQENVYDTKADCDFRRVPGFLVAAFFGDVVREAESLREEAKLAAELGFDAFYLDAVPGLHRPGMRIGNQAKFHVRKYLASLVEAFVAAKGLIFEESEATEFQESPRALHANGRTIRCEHVILATHAPIRGFETALDTALLQTKLAPYNTYAIGARLPHGRMPEALYWDTNDPYYYLRIERGEDHDYAIWGGEDHKTGQVEDTETRYGRLVDALKKILPEAEPDRRWSGQVIETSDGLPFIGSENGVQFIGTGYSGNGMTFGTLAAMMARDAVAGTKNPWTGLFSVSRKATSPSSIWDYLVENKDYPYYMLKGHLFGGRAQSVDDIPAGEGRVVRLNGEKLAVYRSSEGTVTACSAVCPHMGCIVAWNHAEKLWDCPCHGSRFAATGEVMTGPAESSLEARPLP